MMAQYYTAGSDVASQGGGSSKISHDSVRDTAPLNTTMLPKPNLPAETSAAQLCSLHGANRSDGVSRPSRSECRQSMGAPQFSSSKANEELAGAPQVVPLYTTDPTSTSNFALCAPGSARVCAAHGDLPASHSTSSSSSTPHDLSHPPAFAAHNESPVPSTTSSSGVLLEVVLPMRTQLDDREEGMHELGLCVRVGRGGPSQVSRLIQIRVTDPADPFLLFELDLREEDYAAFKQRLELRVDFNGFPRHLVSMLHRIADHTAPLNLSFMVHRGEGGSRATLRVVEATEFKTVEHVSLLLVRQGDVAQKRYLAERLQYYTAAYRRSCADATQTQQNLHVELQALQKRHDALVEQHAALQAQSALAAAQAEQTRLASLSDVRAEAAAEMQQLRTEFESQRRSAQQESSSTQRQLRQELLEKDTALAELRERYRVLSLEQSATQTQREQLQDAVHRQTIELSDLREVNAELDNFKREAKNAMSENELNYVALTERLRAAAASLRDKESELNSLREQYRKQDGYIKILSAQNTHLREQHHHMGKSVKKAHHIIGHQLHTIKTSKERYHIACDRIRTRESLLQERQTALQRTTEELASCQQRLQSAQTRCAEWKEQLQRTDDARETLAQELQRTQTALVQLQRSTGISGRHWSALMMAGAGANTTSSSPLSSAAGCGLSAPSLADSALRQESPAAGAAASAAASSSRSHGDHTNFVNRVDSAKSHSTSSSCGMTAASTTTTTHSPSPIVSASEYVNGAARVGLSTDLMREFDRHARSVSYSATTHPENNSSGTLHHSSSRSRGNMDSEAKAVPGDERDVDDHGARSQRTGGGSSTHTTTDAKKPPKLSAPARLPSRGPTLTRNTAEQVILPRHQTNGVAVSNVSSYF